MNLNPFARRGAPIDFVPPGYSVDLDNNPEVSAGGRGCLSIFMWLLFGIGALIGLAWILMSVLGGGRNQQPPPVPTINAAQLFFTATTTPTPQPTETLTDWDIRGTEIALATATATQDYCAWLTPTAAPTATPVYGLENFEQLQTAVYLATNPAPTIAPQPTTPRSWCDFATPTMTPLALSRTFGTDEPTVTTTPTPTLTPSVTQSSSGGGGGIIQPVPPTAIPINPTTPPMVIPTLAPPTPARTKKPKKTRTPTSTPSATFTLEPTLTVTQSPSLVILFSDCTAGYPTVIVQAAGVYSAPLAWSLIHVDSNTAAASGVWQPADLTPPAAALVAATDWSGVVGAYRLDVDSVAIASVMCDFATPTPTATETPPEMTLEPILTPTQDGLS